MIKDIYNIKVMSTPRNIVRPTSLNQLPGPLSAATPPHYIQKQVDADKRHAKIWPLDWKHVSSHGKSWSLVVKLSLQIGPWWSELWKLPVPSLFQVMQATRTRSPWERTPFPEEGSHRTNGLVVPVFIISHLKNMEIWGFKIWKHHWKFQINHLL